MKDSIGLYIDNISHQLHAMSDDIFDHPEIGEQEFRTSKTITSFLEAHGFTVEMGIGGMETAFRATYENGKGGPSIGFLCEYDAIEDRGHICGHHTEGPGICGAVCALKAQLKDLPYKLVVYGTPAEETISGKVIMLNNGCFRDIDVALQMHPDAETSVDIHSMALSNYLVTFHGKSAHAAAAPDQGRSALDALLLCFQGIEFLREHVPDDIRMHYTVSNSGGPANVVPEIASGDFSLRSYSMQELQQVIEHFYDIVKGAALMTQTTYDILPVKSLKNRVAVPMLNEAVMKNAAYYGARDICPPREKTGSNDFNDVSYFVPGICLRVAFIPLHSAAPHSMAFYNAGKSEGAHFAVSCGAKILAGTAYDLISDSGLLTAIKQEFETNKEKA